MIPVLLVVRWPVGGIRTYLRDLLRSEAFADVRFRVVLPECDETKSLMQEVPNPAVTWHRTENTTAALFKAVSLMPDLRSFALIHSHGFTASCVAAVPTVLRGVPHLATGHDVLVEGQLRGFQGYLWCRVLQAALQSARRIHCVTYQARDNLIEYLPGLRSRKNRVHVIPHGINVSHFYEQSGAKSTYRNGCFRSNEADRISRSLHVTKRIRGAGRRNRFADTIDTGAARLSSGGRDAMVASFEKSRIELLHWA